MITIAITAGVCALVGAACAVIGLGLTIYSTFFRKTK